MIKLMHVQCPTVYNSCFWNFLETAWRTMNCRQATHPIFTFSFMTQSINIRHVLITVFVPISLHSHAMCVPVFNGLNFRDWSEQVQFHFGVLDIDLALQVEKSIAITDASSNEEKAHYKAWKRSNRLSLMFMRISIISNIKSTLPKTDNAKEFMKFVEERS